ncbi:MAG: restriction endonuclease subunit S [Methylobacter sp.]|nr:restriction endonuclease subunit S [Methylobacter sp.]
MSQFKLDSQVDKNKVFLIKRHDLDARLDVEYYQPKHFELLTRLSASLYPIKTLKEISKKIVDGPFGSSVKANDYVENGIPFLRVADITHGDGTIELDGLIYISLEKHREISRSTVFPNDVVIAKTGATMGAASIVPETIKEANIRGDLAAVIVNDTVFANYIVNFINTKIGQDLFWRLNSGATRGRVVISNLRKYPIVIPDAKKMAEINQFVDSAKIRKNQKSQQAQALLAGIDAYLLAELGITLPQQDNTFPKRIFKSNFSELIGKRFDPNWYFNSHYRIEGGKFPNFSLGNIAFVSKGQSITSAQIEVGLYPVVAGGQSSPYKHHAFNYEGNVITVSASGAYAGYVWYHETPIFASDCSVIGSKNEEEIKTLFLAEILKLKQKEIYYLQQGAGQPHVYSRDLIRLNIPVPPKSIQLEILRQIDSIRIQAKQLQTEAAQILANAKAEVERMILGE